MDKSDQSSPKADTAPVLEDVKPAKSNDALNQRMRRNRAIALMIVGFVVLIYLVTVLRIGASIA